MKENVYDLWDVILTVTVDSNILTRSTNCVCIHTPIN